MTGAKLENEHVVVGRCQRRFFFLQQTLQGMRRRSIQMMQASLEIMRIEARHFQLLPSIAACSFSVLEMWTVDARTLKLVGICSRSEGAGAAFRHDKNMQPLPADAEC